MVLDVVPICAHCISNICTTGQAKSRFLSTGGCSIWIHFLVGHRGCSKFHPCCRCKQVCLDPWHWKFLNPRGIAVITLRECPCSKVGLQLLRNMDKGLFPRAFCKVVPDFISRDPTQAIVMHADGAGTKSSLAYIYWKKTGDISVWKGVWFENVWRSCGRWGMGSKIDQGSWQTW